MLNVYLLGGWSFTIHSSLSFWKVHIKIGSPWKPSMYSFFSSEHVTLWNVQQSTQSCIVLFLLCFLLFCISPPVCILWQLQDIFLFEWNYLLCWLWNNSMWKFITWVPISAVTNCHSVDQTVRVRIHFGTAGDIGRSVT